MAEIIVMPKLGFNMSSGKLIQWYKKEGDPLKKGEPFFSVETDKTAIDIEANHDGVFLKKFIEEGDTADVTLPIAIVGKEGEDVGSLVKEIRRQLNITEVAEESAAGAAAASAAGGSVPGSQATAAAAVTAGEEAASGQAVRAPEVGDGGRIKITPRAKRIAQENGLDVNALTIAGTGYEGGICEKDILDYLEVHRIKATPVARKIAGEQGIALDGIQGSGADGRIMKRDLVGEAASAAAPAAPTVPAAAPAEKAAGTAGQAGAQYTADGKEILETVPYGGVRKIIGERLSESKLTSPHVYFTQKVNLEKLLDLRKQVNEAQDKKTSVTDFIARACVVAIKKYPEVNESLAGDKIIRYKTVNLGLAVAAPNGLIVPVIRDAEKKSVVEISKEASFLIDKARAGKLTPAEYSGGTFTISNLGMFGIENFTAIINPPEAAILAVSASKDEAVVITGADGSKSIEIKPMMNITLSVDHRLLDGLLAAQYVTEVKRLLENPIELFL
ncbi:MAG TPA: dihydrolipoamide acetyltransferase family protein [Anaerovoracaceae bacterium]|nr:dihydrolipoamide acetyltransferase family protein [Anaerovoracaceae bacterium]